MKELSIEEKVKAYDKALERAKKLYEQGTITESLSYVFPELKESKDERIRKCIGDVIREYDWSHIFGVTKDDCLSWIEKQGEQKPTDKIEPFDKYEGLTDFERTLADICIGWIGEETGWKQYIKDNADILLKIAVEKFNSVQDAPFEQKPTDNDMKEALRTEYEKGRADAIAEMQKPVDCTDCTNSKGCINCEDGNMKETLVQKPAWSEEDEVKINRIVACLENLNVADNDILLKDIDWLKSLKQRIGG